MKKNWWKALGASAIIVVLFIAILVITNIRVPAKSDDKEEESRGTELEEIVHQREENALMTAFESSQGQLEGIQLSVWSQIKDKNYSLEEMEEIGLECASLLELERNAQIDTIKEEHYTKLMVTNEKEEDMYITIVMESFKEEGLFEDSYLLVDLYLSKDHKDPSEIEEEILDYFTKKGFNYEYAMTIIGTFSNKMNTDIMREVVGRTFKSIEGQIIEGMEETEYGHMVSLTGYSPRLENDILLAGDQINLNAAMRYSDYDDKTYIWIGTPLIATQY